MCTQKTLHTETECIGDHRKTGRCEQGIGD